jgi:hypothetical protein
LQQCGGVDVKRYISRLLKQTAGGRRARGRPVLDSRHDRDENRVAPDSGCEEKEEESTMKDERRAR